MRHAMENIFWLATKEVRSMLHEFALLGLVIYSFSLAIYAQSQGTTGELHSAAMASCTSRCRGRCRCSSPG
jgi:ABC-2 type transport system permease protein